MKIINTRTPKKRVRQIKTEKANKVVHWGGRDHLLSRHQYDGKKSTDAPTPNFPCFVMALDDCCAYTICWKHSSLMDFLAI